MSVTPTSLRDLTATASDPIKLNGKEYRLASPELGDIAEFQAMLQDRPFKDVARRIRACREEGVELLPEERKALFDAATDEALEAENLEASFSPRVAAKNMKAFVWLFGKCLERGNPGLSSEDAARLVTLPNLPVLKSGMDGMFARADSVPT